MSRAKGPNAQAGASRWRNEPGQDAYNRSHGQHHPDQGGHDDDGYAHHQPQSHFPHNAFRQLGGEREQPALSRGSLAALLNRTAATHNPPPNEDRRRPAQPAPSERWSGNADPSGYDLASYQPEQGHGRHAAVHDPYAQQGYDSAAAEGWTGGQWNGQQQGGHQQTYGSMDDLAYDPRAGYDGHQPLEQDYAYEGEEADEPPARRGPRAMVVVGALVGAIAVGGGLAYGYKSFSGGGADGKTPLVRADKGPAKSKPADPGGKDVAHTDKRFLNRLGEDRPAGTVVETGGVGGSASSTDSNGAPRKVSTLVVNRDGSMGAANPVITPTQQQAGSGGSGVPGLLVEGLGSPPQRPLLRGTASSESQGASQTTPVAPRVISRAEPVVETKAEPVPEQQVRAPVKKVVPPRDDAAAPAQSTKVASAAGTIPQAAAGGNGFVPVLSSQKSRMDALKAFADMQQKYTDVLQGRAPDVREVDLGQKGVWHRLMLGPPGSREAANSVCTQLKAHGYTGCWITSY